MNMITRILLLFVISCLLFPAVSCMAGQGSVDHAAAKKRRIKVAVVEFDTKGNFAIPYAGSIVAEWMISELGGLNTFALVERVLLKKVIAEQELAESGFLADNSTGTKLGRLYGVDAIVTGSILKWQQRITITARLIDTLNGTILRTASATARHISQAPRLINQLARQLSGLQPARNETSGTIRNREEALLPLHAVQEPESVSASRDLPAAASARKMDTAANTVRFWREEITGMRFMWIEPGCFIMGQSDYEQDTPSGDSIIFHPEENPAHRVCLEGFWIAETETTNDEYRRLVPGHDSGSFRGMSLNGERQPVVMVNWQQARVFAGILNEHYAGLGASFRLPSEAEWEYAARAGSRGRFPWTGMDICRMANTLDRRAARLVKEPVRAAACDDGHAVTAPVAAYAPNHWGLYDMAGNVREWVEDIYNQRAYLYHEEKNPLYLGVGQARGVRGGSWQDGPERLRCSSRMGQPPENGSVNTGFRLVMERR